MWHNSNWSLECARTARPCTAVGEAKQNALWEGPREVEYSTILRFARDCQGPTVNKPLGVSYARDLAAIFSSSNRWLEKKVQRVSAARLGDTTHEDSLS